MNQITKWVLGGSLVCILAGIAFDMDYRGTSLALAVVGAFFVLFGPIITIVFED